MSADKFHLDWLRMSKLKQLLMLLTAIVKANNNHMLVRLETLDQLTDGDTLILTVNAGAVELRVMPPGSEMLVLDMTAPAAQRTPRSISDLHQEGEPWPEERTTTVLLDDATMAQREQALRAQTHRNQVQPSAPRHVQARQARNQAMREAADRIPPEAPKPLT